MDLRLFRLPAPVSGRSSDTCRLCCGVEVGKGNDDSEISLGERGSFDAASISARARLVFDSILLEGTLLLWMSRFLVACVDTAGLPNGVPAGDVTME